jgi:hypothetical protein
VLKDKRKELLDRIEEKNNPKPPPVILPGPGAAASAGAPPASNKEDEPPPEEKEPNFLKVTITLTGLIREGEDDLLTGFRSEDWQLGLVEAEGTKVRHRPTGEVFKLLQLEFHVDKLEAWEPDAQNNDGK